MSIKLHDCPHSDKIVCDTGYSVREANRQKMTEHGQYIQKLFHITTECKCDPEKCQRYLNKMKELAKQKTK
ncbi:MAG: hypothetical protein J6S12_04160 [Alphaproteobacteria bacterium]|jgi:hypothetical protein|nr:hypothetical protein [Alphaproteobacteria bacterium]